MKDMDMFLLEEDYKHDLSKKTKTTKKESRPGFCQRHRKGLTVFAVIYFLAWLMSVIGIT